MIEVIGGEQSKISSRLYRFMRRLAILAFVLTACSSSSPQSSGTKANIPEPQIGIEELSGPGDQGFPYGAFEVKYQFQIGNSADVPITLKRITIQTVNPAGGAYTLRAPNDYYFNKVIPAKSVVPVEFWAKAYGYGRSMRETEPVTVRGVAYFQTPNGYYNQVFVRELDQM